MFRRTTCFIKSSKVCAKTILKKQEMDKKKKKRTNKQAKITDYQQKPNPDCFFI